ncbi:Bifunctional glutamate/proline--tRNA ligase [Lamellibrachia satsuma]|nr:Bifunctional glutamate/proline--tRNA ligase [Lamellibrachia satsuma]
MTKVTVSKTSPSGAVLLAIEYAKGSSDVLLQEGTVNSLVTSSGETFTSNASILRYLARAAPALGLYGNSIMDRTEVDHWLDFCTWRLTCLSEVKDALQYLDKVLAPLTYLVTNSLSLADLAVWDALRGSQDFQKLLVAGEAPRNVARYYTFLSELEKFKTVSKRLPEVKVAPGKEGKKERKEEGKFIELPGAEMGKVVVRFPPEASGFLHVGHAKAALLNQYYQQAFKGKLVMRFDDTNPAKEEEEYEKVILEDIAMLGLKPDVFTFTSDHFERLLSLCEKMIESGKAYVDDTDAETMKKEREERVESAARNNSVAENLRRWCEMKQGSECGLKCCVRAKMDMKSDNGCLRDPTIYRCKSMDHPRTGNKYK